MYASILINTQKALIVRLSQSDNEAVSIPALMDRSIGDLGEISKPLAPIVDEWNRYVQELAEAGAQKAVAITRKTAGNGARRLRVVTGRSFWNDGPGNFRSDNLLYHALIEMEIDDETGLISAMTVSVVRENLEKNKFMVVSIKEALRDKSKSRVAASLGFSFTGVMERAKLIKAGAECRAAG